MNPDRRLADELAKALQFEAAIGQAVLGQERAIRLLAVAVFARGHVLLEGGVGVGKTTLLRAVARAVGGAYERVEGSIDLMPADLIYYTYLDEAGKPAVSPGPLLRHGAALSVFFFNEINRARPQVHALLLRAMAERSLAAFNREHRFPHLLVFADRNRVEKEETFELPAAARDRFLLEIAIEPPADPNLLEDIAFEPRYHNTERLVESVAADLLDCRGLDELAEAIQQHVHASPALRAYVMELWRASHSPANYGIRVADADAGDLVAGGASPRAMSHLVRAARVQAWLEGRCAVQPEDVRAVFPAALSHRVFLAPVYEYRRAELVPELVERILHTVAAP